MKYWVNIDDIDHGPYTKMEIRNYINQGSLSMNDSICVVGDTTWSRVKDFFPEPPPKPPQKLLNVSPFNSISSREIKPSGTWEDFRKRL